jgi:glycyl-tRNA synthetase beta chain
MSEFLLEIFSEEIPAKFQLLAKDQLKSMVEEKLKKLFLDYKSVRTFSGPRRLVAVVQGLPLHQSDRIEERKGPRVDAPLSAIEGFFASAEISRQECEEIEVPGKGIFLFAKISKKGEKTADLLPIVIKEIIQEFHWPKTMRWGNYSMTWARPIRNVLAVFNGQTVQVSLEDPDVLTTHTTQGHRFLSSSTNEVTDFLDYEKKLEENYVIVDGSKRRQKIKDQIDRILKTKKFDLKEDEELLDEVTGLVEWPKVLLGRIEEPFMMLPPEVLMTSMKVHQRYFSVLDDRGNLAPFFLLVSNMETPDPSRIVEGNERVLRARLRDATFFWHQDVKVPLYKWNASLKNRIFHAELGSIYDKGGRLTGLATTLLLYLPLAEAEDVREAAGLLKADLATAMVGEFPELQGIMGFYYAKVQGFKAPIAQAIRDHYAPMGPMDFCPKEPLSVLMALSDKLDTLVGFFGVGIFPTASKDPYALRRTALGIIRIVLENKLDVKLSDLLAAAYAQYGFFKREDQVKTIQLVQEFIQERLKVYFKSLFDHTLINAALGKKWGGNILKTHEELMALQRFLEKEEGQNLLMVHKRVVNILKQSADVKDGKIEPSLFEASEITLYESLKNVQKELVPLEGVSIPDYEKIFEVLGNLFQPLTGFFDNVLVQVEDPSLRLNRLGLLNLVKETFERSLSLEGL